MNYSFLSSCNNPAIYSSFPYLMNKSGLANNISMGLDADENFNFKLYNEFLLDSGKFFPPFLITRIIPLLKNEIAQDREAQHYYLKTPTIPQSYVMNHQMDFLTFNKIFQVFKFLNKKLIVPNPSLSSPSDEKVSEIVPIKKECAEKNSSFISQQFLMEFFQIILKSTEAFNDKMSAFLSKIFEKEKQAHDVYMIFVKKYCRLKKTKEEYTKFLFRKFFKHLKKEFQKTKKTLPQKTIHHFYIIKYFSHEITNPETKKKMLVKTKPSISLIKKSHLFKFFYNENFLTEFEAYLKTFPTFYKEDCERKLQKLILKIIKLYNKKKFSRLSKLSQLPWIDIWIEKCQKLGIDLVTEFKLTMENK